MTQPLLKSYFRAGVWPVGDDTAWDACAPTEVPGFKTQLHSQFQLPVEVHSGRQKMMAQVAGDLPPTCETWVDFLAPGFSLAQPELSLAFGE